MSMHEITRYYNFSDGKLKKESDRIAGCVTRDIADFATRAIAAADVTAFEAKVVTFDDFETDAELEGAVVTATEAKDALAEDIRKKIRTIRSMAQQQYHGNGKYKTFAFENMDKLPDPDLYRLAKRVVRVGTALLAEMAAQGLTAAVLTSLQTDAADFDTAMDDQETAVEKRDLQTQHRINLGNNVYTVLVKFADVGKSIYADTDEAKYNDYVLYDGVAGGGF